MFWKTFLLAPFALRTLSRSSRPSLQGRSSLIAAKEPSTAVT